MIAKTRRNDLQADRKSGTGECARNADRRLLSDIEWIAERRPRSDVGVVVKILWYPAVRLKGGKPSGWNDEQV